MTDVTNNPSHNLRAQQRKRQHNAQMLLLLAMVAEHSQHYRIQVNPGLALAYFDQFPPKANTSADNLIDLISEINALVPKMDFGGDNPNNGKYIHNFEIGREYSTVLYLNITLTYLTTHNRLKMSPSQIIELIQPLQPLGHKYGADEADIIEASESSITIRYWWD